MVAPAPQARPPRILVVDADAGAADALARELSLRGHEVVHAVHPAAAMSVVAAGGIDAVVLNTPCGDDDWISAIAALKGLGAGLPLLVLDGTGQAAELGRLLPEDRLPDAVLPQDARPTVVFVSLAELLSAGPEPSFAEVLVAYCGHGETGVLEVRSEDGVCTRILLRDGRPAFAEGGALRETLGRLLLRRGTLSEADYVRVIERMTERLIENEATRMGEVLIELSLLSPQEVFEALSIQVREKILGCFRADRFGYHFDPLEALPEDALAYSCPPVEALVLAGIREHFDEERVERLVGPRAEAYGRLRESPEETAVRLHASPAEQRLLRDLGGDRPIGALRKESALGSLQAGQLLAALLATGALVVSLEPDALRTPRPRAVRPVHSSVTPRRVQRRERAPQPPPEPVTRPPAAPASQPPAGASRSLRKLHRELVRAGRAPAPAPAPRDARSAMLEAERAYRNGLRLLEQAALGGAHKAFAEACAHNADEPEYALLEGWVAAQIAKDDDTRSGARERAANSARRLLKRDPESVRAHSILGQLATATGDFEAAERHFRLALRIAPEDRDSLRGMRTLDQRRRSQPGSSPKS